MATKKVTKSHKTAQKYTGISPIMSTVNVSKPATILYKKLPDNMILITGFENFLTADEIKAKLGEEVARIYFGYTDCMEKKFTNSGKENIQVGKKPMWSLTFAISCGPNKIVSNESNDVFVGDIYCKQDFSKLIGRVKKCGSLLHDIIAAVNGGQVKRITI
jgi:hypothetical protein